MAEVVMFHSVLGLRPGVLGAAERLRAAGHTVHTPDLFEGEVFDDLDDGMRKEETLGYREIARRAEETLAGLPAGLVFVGFSMGVAHAEQLTASRPGALGAVLMHGAVPVEALTEHFGIERWPEGVPVQVHYATDNPWVEAEQEVAPLGEDLRRARVPGATIRRRLPPRARGIGRPELDLPAGSSRPSRGGVGSGPGR
jgi:dienelactone hydrolase